jgi:hypothetical protein
MSACFFLWTAVGRSDDVPIRKGWRKLTRNEIAGMRNHYAAGISIRRIAIAYGVDWSTVWRRCSDVRK